MVSAEGVKRLTKPDKITWDQPRSLMNQLVKRMLTVGSRLAPIDGPGIVVEFFTIESYMFAVALHRQLLQVGRKSLQILLVRQHRDGLSAEEIVVPDGQEAHEHRQIALKRSGAEMFVHLMEAIQHGAEVIRADCNHR